MPSRASQICAHAGCGTLCTGRYCDEHRATDLAAQRQQQDAKRADDPYRKFYSTARWRRLRRIVLARDPLCKDPFKTGCQELSTDADHIIPVRQGGPMWSLANLQGLCGADHRRKTAQEREVERQHIENKGDAKLSQSETSALAVETPAIS